MNAIELIGIDKDGILGTLKHSKQALSIFVFYSF
jgi:hypothetical protein